jgi:hypothetical protein
MRPTSLRCSQPRLQHNHGRNLPAAANRLFKQTEPACGRARPVKRGEASPKALCGSPRLLAMRPTPSVTWPWRAESAPVRHSELSVWEKKPKMLQAITWPTSVTPFSRYLLKFDPHDPYNGINTNENNEISVGVCAPNSQACGSLAENSNTNETNGLGGVWGRGVKKACPRRKRR